MLLPFTGNAEVFQCFMDTAIDFCKLFGSKKDNVGDEAGAGSEVALGRGVTVHTAGRSVEVPRVQASALPHTFPGSKLDAVPGGVARQTVSKDNSLGSPQPPTFMLTQKISGIAGGATPSRAKK